MELNKDNLYEEYIVNNKTQAECAEIFNCSIWKIIREAKKYNLTKNKIKKPSLEELKNMYLYKGMSGEEISQKVGCSKATIYRTIKKNKIIRDDEQLKVSKEKEHIKRMNSKKKYSFDKNEMKGFLKEGKTTYEIADYYKCSSSAVGFYLRNNNLSEYRNWDAIKENKKVKLKNNLLNKYGVSNVMFIDEFKQKSIDNKKSFNISKDELKLVEYIKSVYDGEVIRYHDKSYELDIFIPEKSLGIEFNGTYFHSQLFKDKNYHYNKSCYFENMGIRIIHIFEYEWNNERQRPILENIIKNALGINENKIYARKCSIEIRSSASMRDFFDKNNIQGFRGGKFSICLVYDNEVVMAYMMGHCFFGKGKYQWEVIRGATKLGVNVIGGASKIWNYFIKTYNPDNCVYYIDYNYFNGNSLPYLGLTYIKSQSGFKNWWVKEDKVKNREPLRHKEITALYKTGDVVPIYNAGTKVYVWVKS